MRTRHIASIAIANHFEHQSLVSSASKAPPKGDFMLTWCGFVWCPGRGVGGVWSRRVGVASKWSLTCACVLQAALRSLSLSLVVMRAVNLRYLFVFDSFSLLIWVLKVGYLGAFRYQFVLSQRKKNSMISTCCKKLAARRIKPLCESKGM